MTQPSDVERRLNLSTGSFPFASHFCDLGGARLHYVDEGEGEAIVMVHGNPSWSFLYRKLIMNLRGRYRCIAIDLPGFGLSEPPASFGHTPEEHAGLIAAWLDCLEIKNATLVAHDWGGPIGIAASFSQPGRITRYVLGNTWAWPVNGDWHFEWFSRLMGGGFGRYAARKFNLFVKGVLPSSMRRGPLSAEAKIGYEAPLLNPARRHGTHVFPREILKSRQFLNELEKNLHRIDGKNLLFLWPDKDIAFRAKELARWKCIYPDAEVVPLKNCGHFLWEEAGDECAQEISKWLLQVSTRLT